MRELNRRSVLKTGAAGIAGVTVGLAGCTGGNGGGSSTSTPAQSSNGGGSGGAQSSGGGGSTTTSAKPLNIGVILPLSGAESAVGLEVQHGMKLGKTYLKGAIDGHEINIDFRDTQTKPAIALQQVKSLVEDKGVDAVLGPVSSASGLAVLPYIKSKGKVPFIPSQCGTEKAREDSKYCTKYAFFPWVNDRQQVIPWANFLKGELPKHTGADTSKVFFVGLDYAAGQSLRDLQKAKLKEMGAEMVGASMVPLGTTDLAPYLTDASKSDAGVITGFMPGGNGIRMIKQAAQFGLPQKKAMVPLGDTTSQLVLAAVGKAAKGWFGANWYDPSRDSDMNNQFKKLYLASKHKFPPNDLAVSGFNCVYSLAQGVKKAGSTTPDDVVSAMAGMSFASPMGQLTYRASDHQTKLNMIGYEVVNGDNSGWSAKLDIFSRYTDVIGPQKCSV